VRIDGVVTVDGAFEGADGPLPIAESTFTLELPPTEEGWLIVVLTLGEDAGCDAVASHEVRRPTRDVDFVPGEPFSLIAVAESPTTAIGAVQLNVRVEAENPEQGAVENEGVSVAGEVTGTLVACASADTGG
jgi:hypothetical protein